jgi:hypothetical protein
MLTLTADMTTNVPRLPLDTSPACFCLPSLFGLHHIASRLRLPSRVARFFLVRDTKTGKMYQINTKYTKCS